MFVNDAVMPIVSGILNCTLLRVVHTLLHSVGRSLWSLDLCVLLLPALSQLIASKYDRFVLFAAFCHVL